VWCKFSTLERGSEGRRRLLNGFSWGLPAAIFALKKKFGGVDKQRPSIEAATPEAPENPINTTL
jgi:hypothetical protein